MKKKNHVIKSSSKGNHAFNTSDKNDLAQKIESIMLENYASTQINLMGLTEEDKKQKLESATQVVKILIDSLGAKGLLQNMLVTQLLGIHDLQQKLLPYVDRSMNSPANNQYYVNAVTKLTNAFVSQITLLQKLQGQSQQKVTVEHLHIHHGAQAIVGQVNTGGS